MSKSYGQKLKLLYLLDILRDTDETRPLNATQIINALSLQGISAERKSIYDDLQTLESYGFDIIRTEKGCFLGEREFETVELRLLIDSVLSSSFITEKKTAVLVKKLAAFAPKSERASLEARTMQTSVKTVNEKVYNTVDALQNAIFGDNAISFTYYTYAVKDGSVEMVPRRNGQKHIVSPWALRFDDGFYYLTAYDEQVHGLRNYRVDKIAAIETVRVGRKGGDEYSKATGKTFGMFGGESVSVRLEVASDKLGVIIDRFGRLPILNSGRGSFFVTVSVVPSPIFLGWIMSFGGDIKVIDPPETAARIKALAQKNAEIYK